MRIYKSGVDGVDKKTILAFHRINFKNSAICRIFKSIFSRMKKELF